MDGPDITSVSNNLGFIHQGSMRSFSGKDTGKTFEELANYSRNPNCHNAMCLKEKREVSMYYK